MAEHTNDIDPAERVRQLQARRAASGRTPRPTNASDPRTTHETAAPTAGSRPRNASPRRRHPAAATRWLLGGLSIASFFGIAGTVAAANVHGVATPVAAPLTAAAPAAPASTATAATPAAATPRVQSTQSAPAPVAPVVHTTSGGS